MRKILATGATKNYLPVIAPYLKTISAHSNFDVNVLVALDCEPEAPANVKVARLRNSLVSIKHSNNCLQHGEFMLAEGFDAFSEQDVICFTDGDILMQRALNQDEIRSLESLADNDVMVQYNSGKDDNLRDEYYRLQPGAPHENLEAKIGRDFRTMGCFNTGVLACNKKTWAELFRLYAEYHPLVREHAAFGHYASQQWILSLILSKHMSVKIMAPSFHTHFHHGRVAGSCFFRNVHHQGDEVVLFSHYAVRDGLDNSKESFARHQSEYLKQNFGWRRHFRFLGL